MIKQSNKNHRIVGKIIIRADLKNTTPLLIGSGLGDASDHEVIRRPDGSPYIPASSIAGSLKAFMRVHDLTQDGDHLWGKNGKDEHGEDIQNTLQSHIRFDDLLPVAFSEEDISLRDGVKICRKTATAEDGKKYDYQLLEPGLTFRLQAEITVRNDKEMSLAKVEKFVAELKAVLQHEDFRLGAFSNTGFGKFDCSGFYAWHYDFSSEDREVKKKEADAWFDFLNEDILKQEVMTWEHEVGSLRREGRFTIQANFSLKGSLMIGAYSSETGDESDKSQLKSRDRDQKDRYVLPGKSIRGAIRHRAVKIQKIIAGDPGKAEKMVDDLFGLVVEEKGRKPIKKRGRLRVEESLFKENSVASMAQDRIKIDRFTGGTMDGALFNSQPIWTTGRSKEAVTLTFTILKGATPAERKLLLMLLKDLWLEDLAIGGEKNVGRGVLTGLSARVWNEGKLVAEIKEQDPGKNKLSISPEHRANLEKLIVEPQKETDA